MQQLTNYCNFSKNINLCLSPFSSRSNFAPNSDCYSFLFSFFSPSSTNQKINKRRWNPEKLHQQNNGAQQLASEATVYIQLEDVNDEIPLFTEREQETVLEGEPIGTKVTQVNAIDKDGTFPNNQVSFFTDF